MYFGLLSKKSRLVDVDTDSTLALSTLTAKLTFLDLETFVTSKSVHALRSDFEGSYLGCLSTIEV